MKLSEVFRYELGLFLRSRTTWIYAVLLFAFAVAMGSDVGTLDEIHANAPKQLAFDSVIVGLFGVAVSVGIFGDAALRAIDSRMDPLVFALPMTKIDYLGGRYAAAVVVNAILLITVPLGFAVPTLLDYPEPAHFGPFRIAALLQAWLIFLLPNMAFSGAILFTVGALSRRITPVYITGFVLLMASLITGDADFRGAIPDPAGLATLDRSTNGWTPAELNSQLVVSSALLWNRVLWLAITTGVLALLYQRFRLAHVERGNVRRKRLVVKAAPAVQKVTIRATPTFGPGTSARQVLAIARNSLDEVAWNRWFALVMIATGVWSATLVESATVRPFDTTTWPVTMLVTAVFSRDLLVGLFLIIGILAGELVWKDRDVGVAEIKDATPVAEGVAFGGRLVALITIAAMLLAATMAGGMIGQAAFEYYNFELLLYTRVLFGMNFAELALMAVLVIAVHVVVNHKHLGIIAMLMALVLPFLGARLKHYLFVYNGDAGWVYSDMNGFGPFVAPFVWFKIYSAGWAMLLGIVACLFWVRGRESGAVVRLLKARSRFAGPLRAVALMAVGVILASGSFIFYNTNVLNAFDAAGEHRALHAEYEKRYSQFETRPQPSLERARLRVELYPDRQTVDITGSFHLVNRTAASIGSIHVSDNQHAARSMSLDRQATATVQDTVLGYRVFSLARALAPGDSATLSFAVSFQQRGFPLRDFQTDVVDNGTYFGRRWLPVIGYRRASDTSDFEVAGEGKVHVNAIIGTASDQVAVTSGALRREWAENGRRYFEYDTETAQAFAAPVISARYAVATAAWADTATSTRDITLRVFHHPGHNRNLESLMGGMKAALDDYRARFGPYPDAELWVVEIPRYHREVRTHPGIIVFSEGRFIAREPPDSLRQLLSALIAKP